MPGSRKSEIQRHWPIFLQTLNLMQKNSLYNIVPILLEAPNVEINNIPNHVIATKDYHHEILSIADAAIVCSGTATLETAILGCPMVVCYQLSPITWFLAQRMSSVKYLSLVNLISEKDVVKELLQNNMSAKNIVEEIIYLLSEHGKKNYKKRLCFACGFLRIKNKCISRGCEIYTAINYDIQNQNLCGKTYNPISVWV